MNANTLGWPSILSTGSTPCSHRIGKNSCDPEIRELAIMPEINGEEDDEADVGGEDEGEDGGQP